MKTTIDENMERIGNKIIAATRSCGLSGLEIAANMSVRPAEMRSMQYGAMIGIETLIKFMHACGYDVDMRFTRRRDAAPRGRGTDRLSTREFELGMRAGR